MKELEAKFTLYGERYKKSDRDIPTLNILLEKPDEVTCHEYMKIFKNFWESKGPKFMKSYKANYAGCACYLILQYMIDKCSYKF